jgi:hypothetical protein
MNESLSRIADLLSAINTTTTIGNLNSSTMSNVIIAVSSTFVGTIAGGLLLFFIQIIGGVGSRDFFSGMRFFSRFLE